MSTHYNILEKNFDAFISFVTKISAKQPDYNGDDHAIEEWWFFFSGMGMAMNVDQEVARLSSSHSRHISNRSRELVDDIALSWLSPHFKKPQGYCH